MKNYLTGSLVLLFLWSGCKPAGPEKVDVIARVNNTSLSLEELDRKIPENTSPDLQQALKRQLMEKWIENELFYQSALDEGFELSDLDREFVKEYEKNLIVENFLEKKFNKEYRVHDQEIEDYYNQNKDEFTWDGDYVHIIHLLIENKDDKIFSEINKSKDLLDIVQTYFFDIQSTSLKPNGDLGYVKLNQLPSELVNVIKRMKTGRISRPVKTDLGYHFVQLLDTQSAGNPKPPDLVRDEIILRLKIRKKNEAVEEYKKEIRAKNTIQTDISRLLKSN